jgi:hypothetical protein
MKRRSSLLGFLWGGEQPGACSGNRSPSQWPEIVANARKPSWQVPAFDVVPLGIPFSARRTPSVHLTRSGLAGNRQMARVRAAFGWLASAQRGNIRPESRSMQAQGCAKHTRRWTPYRSYHGLSDRRVSADAGARRAVRCAARPAGPTGTADYVFHPAGIASDGDFCWWVGHSLEPESARFEIKGCRNSS